MENGNQMFECHRCGEDTKLSNSKVIWHHSEHLCENCYFSALGTELIVTPINYIPKLPKLSGIYNS